MPKKIFIGRPIAGCTLNGIEYLIEPYANRRIAFECEGEAWECLKEELDIHNEDEMDKYGYILHEEELDPNEEVMSYADYKEKPPEA